MDFSKLYHVSATIFLFLSPKSFFSQTDIKYEEVFKHLVYSKKVLRNIKAMLLNNNIVVKLNIFY